MNIFNNDFTPVKGVLDRVEKLLEVRLAAAEGALGELGDESLHARGKRLRPVLSLLSGSAAGTLDERHASFAAAVELIHMATLAHDDVIDRAKKRRGRTSLNNARGNKVAVLYGDYLLSEAFVVLSEIDRSDLLPVMVRITREICGGEIWQLRHRYDFSVSEEEYLRMVESKTASLFSASCRYGAALAGAPPAVQDSLGRYGHLFGTAYQIIDDCNDITGGSDGKDYLKDMEDGRMTLPFILMLRKLGERNRRRMEKALSRGKVSRCRKTIISSGVLTRCMEKAGSLMKQAHKTLDGLPHSPAKQCMQALSELPQTV